jgi:hypothetical protein
MLFRYILEKEKCHALRLSWSDSADSIDRKILKLFKLKPVQSQLIGLSASLVLLLFLRYFMFYAKTWPKTCQTM